MNYREQETYLKQSRLRAIVMVAVWLAAAAAAFAMFPMSGRSKIAFGCIGAAVAISLLYTPDYLHLTVNPRKKIRWAIMVRWRIFAVVLAIGFALCFSARQDQRRWDAAILVFAVACLIGANSVARKQQTWSGVATYLWAVDWAVLLVSSFLAHNHPLVTAGLFALAAHLAVLVRDQQIPGWAIQVTAIAWLSLAAVFHPLGSDFIVGAALVLASAATTAWLTDRAQAHNFRNMTIALDELIAFTGYPVEQIKRMWLESDKELARNWVAANLDENDSQALAEWYRQNSELYMFAISGYNLDYKRIRSNLKVLRFARGACLDYGAGNGEIILELARRGHPATYYDVDGVSAAFARHRAQRQRLIVNFTHSKTELAEVAQQGRFDTIFSLDVLEHLPDLPGELAFLSSLLNPGGRFVFDVPAGSTKSHPMHLNHHVEVRSVLAQRGLQEQRSLWYRLPFVKQEKYVFIVGS